MPCGTKERILTAALDLFSQYGYEAVSVSQLAGAVGIKAPSLYKHFSSKQEIFSELILWMNRQYEANSAFPVWRGCPDQTDHLAFKKMSPDEVADLIITQLRFITSDPVITKMRKIGVTEQFRDPMLREQLESHQYTANMRYFSGIFRRMTENGLICDASPELLALEFISPISVQLERIDRAPETAAEAESLIRQHIISFYKHFTINRKEEENA